MHTANTKNSDTQSTQQSAAQLPSTPDHDTLQSQTTRKRLSSPPRLLIGIGVLLIAIVVAAVNYASLRTAKSARTPTSSPSLASTSSTSTASDEECSTYSYTPVSTVPVDQTMQISGADLRSILLRSGDHYIESDVIAEQVREFAGLTGFVGDLTYHQATDKAAFLLSPTEYAGAGDTVTAWLYDFKTREKTQLLSYLSTAVPQNVKFSVDRITLTDITFTEDGRQLLITSNNALWIYDIGSRSLEKVYEDATAGITGSFFAPEMSEDGRKVALRVGHYEGSSSGVIDVATQKYYELPFKGYIYGVNPIGWQGTELLLHEFDENGERLCKSNWLGENKYCSPLNFEYLEWTAFNKGEEVIGINREEKMTGQFLCNNVNRKYEVASEISHVVYAKATDTSPTELFQIDTTRSSGMDAYNSIESLFFTKLEDVPYAVLHVKRYLAAGQPESTYFGMNLNEPGKYVRLTW